VIKAPAGNVEPVVGHELEDLKHALLASHSGGEWDLDGLRLGELRTMLEDVVGEDPSDAGELRGGLHLDRNASARGRHRAGTKHGAGVRFAGRNHRVVWKTCLNGVAGIGPVGRERDAIVPRMEHHLVDRHRDHPAFLECRDNGLTGIVDRRHGRAFVAARPELLGHPAVLIVHRPRRGRLEHEVRLRDGGNEDNACPDGHGAGNSGDEGTHWDGLVGAEASL